MSIENRGVRIRPVYKAERVNLFDPKAGFLIGAWSSADGNVTEKPADIVSMSNSRIELATESAWRGYASGLIEVKPSTTYRVTYDRSETPAVYFAVDERGADGEFLRVIGYSTSATHKSYSFTTSANARYIKLVFEHGGQAGVVGNMIVNNIELHETSATVPFEKYKNYLPAGYREVEYIESTGTQRIDTGYSVGLGERWYSYLDAQYTEATSASQVILSTGISDGSWLGQRSNMFTIGGSDGNFYDSTTRRSIRSIWGNAPETTIDSTRKYFLTSIDTKDGNIGLFGSLTSNPYYSKARIYYCQILNEKRIPVRTLIPCIRTSDEKAGLYDTVTRTFLADANGGNFVAGKVISDNISKVFHGKELVYDDKFHGYTRLESITSVRGAETIRVPFYMDHKYITDIQFSNDFSEMSTSNRVLRPLNVGSTYGGIYWEADFSTSSDPVNGLIAAGGGNRIPVSSAKAVDRNKVLWYYDTENRRTYVEVNGARISRAPGSASIPEGDTARGIVDNVTDYYGKQTIFRETEYDADMSHVLHDFVPVRRNGDGRLGFYDSITGNFYCASNNTGLTGNELPITGYTELQYAQLNGDSWFNTGVQSSIYGYKFLIDATIVKTTVSSIGVSSTTPNWINITNGNIQSFSNTNLVPVSAGDHVNYGLEFFESSDSKAFATNLTQGSTRTITSTVKGMGGAYIHFIKLTNVATSNAVIKVHGFKIWRQGVLVRDFIPVKRNSDGKVGFFDTVEKKFYINQGANDFTAGPNK